MVSIKARSTCLKVLGCNHVGLARFLQGIITKSIVLPPQRKHLEVDKSLTFNFVTVGKYLHCFQNF